ncbi:hypothetical protein V8E51_005386 [Hyaloscypha variabilis]
MVVSEFEKVSSGITKEFFESRKFGELDPLSFSSKDIVNEALPLYPPPGKIFRRVGDKEKSVDVVAIHREAELWGDNVLEFEPSRWAKGKGLFEYFMPFGVGALSCPTRGNMGPRFIGVIVAALFYNLRGFELVGKESDAIINGNDWRERTGLHNNIIWMRVSEMCLMAWTLDQVGSPPWKQKLKEMMACRPDV